MPTYRDRPPSYGGGYGLRAGSPVTDILMHRGLAQAEAHQRSGENWGQAIGGATQLIGAGFEQAAMAKRDAAWVKYVESGEWAQDPKAALANSVRMWGPQDGPKQFQALQGAAQLMQEKRDPEQDRKSLGAIIGAGDRLSDEGRAYMWPQLVSLGKRVYPDLKIDEEYTPDVWSMVSALGPDLRGDKKPGTREMRTRNADGSETSRIVEDVPGQEFTSAPEPPKQPNLQTIETADGIRTFNPQTGEVGPVVAKPKASSAAAEPLMAIMGPDGQPVYVPRSQAVGKKPASNREQGRPVTSGDSTTVADLDTALDELNTLARTLAGNKSTGTAAKAGAMLPNFVTEITGWGLEPKQKQATIDLVKQIIGKGLEGGVLRKEDEYKYEKILPTIGDAPEVVQSKLIGLWDELGRKRQNFLDAKSDAGYDVTKFNERGQKQRQFGSDVSALTVTTPDGQVFRFKNKAEADGFRKLAGIK